MEGKSIDFFIIINFTKARATLTEMYCSNWGLYGKINI